MGALRLRVRALWGYGSMGLGFVRLGVRTLWAT